MLIITLLISCDNDDDTPDCQGIDCLPEATQTGAGTFGCLVNGEPFYAFGGVNAQYQLINGEYYFVVGIAREIGFPTSVVIESSEYQVFEGAHILNSEESGSIYARVTFSPEDSFFSNTTNQNNNGILFLNKLDQQNQIVSGTFEFDVINPNNNEVIQIREGRFDSFYAQ